MASFPELVDLTLDISDEEGKDKATSPSRDSPRDLKPTIFPSPGRGMVGGGPKVDPALGGSIKKTVHWDELNLRGNTSKQMQQRRVSDPESLGNAEELEFEDVDSSSSDNGQELSFIPPVDLSITIPPPPTSPERLPPVLSPQILVSEIGERLIVDNERPCTSSSLKNYRIPKIPKQNLGLPPNITELIKDSPPTPKPATRRAPRSGGNKKASTLTPEQLEILKSYFQKSIQLNVIDRIELQDRTGLDSKKISSWFNQQRTVMKRHEGLKEQKLAWKRHAEIEIIPDRTVRPEEIANNFNSPSKRHRQSEPNPIQSDSTARSNEGARDQRRSEPAPRNNRNEGVAVMGGGLSREQNIERRMDNIRTVTIEDLHQQLRKSEERVLGLVKLFIEKKWDLKNTLVKETARLKEMSTRNSPFTTQHHLAIKLWQRKYFELLKNGKSESAKERISYAETQIVEVWHPKMLYGKLSGVSLEVAITDWTFHSTGRMAATTQTEYLIPEFLRRKVWEPTS